MHYLILALILSGAVPPGWVCAPFPKPLPNTTCSCHVAAPAKCVLDMPALLVCVDHPVPTVEVHCDKNPDDI